MSDVLGQFWEFSLSQMCFFLRTFLIFLGHYKYYHFSRFCGESVVVVRFYQRFVSGFFYRSGTTVLVGRTRSLGHIFAEYGAATKTINSGRSATPFPGPAPAAGSRRTQKLSEQWRADNNERVTSYRRSFTVSQSYTRHGVTTVLHLTVKSITRLTMKLERS